MTPRSTPRPAVEVEIDTYRHCNCRRKHCALCQGGDAPAVYVPRLPCRQCGSTPAERRDPVALDAVENRDGGSYMCSRCLTSHSINRRP